MLSIAAAAFLASITIPNQIDVGEADWTTFPHLATKTVAVPNGAMVGRVEQMLKQGECKFPGQKPSRFDLTVNYAVKLDPQGNATNIVVEDVGCRALELYVGRIAADIVKGGFVQVAPPAKASWYGNQINFNLR